MTKRKTEDQPDLKTISNPLGYEDMLADGIGLLEGADDSLDRVEKSLTRVTDLIVNENGPAELVTHCKDKQIAQEHLKVTLARLTDIENAATSIGKRAKSARDKVEFLKRALGTPLYRDLLDPQTIMDLGEEE